MNGLWNYATLGKLFLFYSLLDSQVLIFFFQKSLNLILPLQYRMVQPNTCQLYPKQSSHAFGDHISVFQYFNTAHSQNQGCFPDTQFSFTMFLALIPNSYPTSFKNQHYLWTRTSFTAYLVHINQCYRNVSSDYHHHCSTTVIHT